MSHRQGGAFRAIKHARGEIDIATLCPHDEKSIEQLSLNEGPESVNIFELPDFQGMFRRTHREDVCTEKTGDDLCAVHPYFDQRDEHLLWLFIADTPQYPPTIFPSGLVHVPNLFSILALNGKFWATENEAKKGLEINDKKPTLLKNLQWTDSFQSIELVAASPDSRFSDTRTSTGDVSKYSTNHRPSKAGSTQNRDPRGRSFAKV